MGVENIEFHEPLSRKEQEELLRNVNKDPEAKNKIVLHNLKLVLWVAKKYHKEGRTELEDLFQWGVIGLLEAIEKYELERGGEFSTVAVWYIQKEIKRNMFSFSNTIPLDKEIGESEDITLIEVIPDSRINIEKDVTGKIFVEQFKKEIKDKLSDYEYNIFVLYYGLDGLQYTIDELAIKYNKTAEDIRQAKNAALNKIKRTMYVKQLWKELDIRTSFVKSIDYTTPRRIGGEFISPVESIVLARERILDLMIRKEKRNAE